MTLTIGIDPGPENSDAVILDEEGLIVGKLSCPNGGMYTAVNTWVMQGERVVVEDWEPYGGKLGQESVATIKFIGALVWAHGCGAISRPDVCEHLCNRRKVPDSAIREALMYLPRYGPGKEKAVGKKKTPGPLYGITGHLWAALAVAVTAMDTKGT